MKKKRGTIYINTDRNRNEIINYGIEFKDFYSFLPLKPQNLLLIKSDFSGGVFNSNTRLITVDEIELKELLEENIYDYGDFCWVDFNEINLINSMKPHDIAALLYFGHTSMVLEKPFLGELGNKYAYFAHDDGWFCKVFCKDFDAFFCVIENLIKARTEDIVAISVDMTRSLKKHLLELMENGLLIDFDGMVLIDSHTEIPVYSIGKYEDVDFVLNNRDKLIRNAMFKGRLVLSDDGWSIENT